MTTTAYPTALQFVANLITDLYHAAGTEYVSIATIRDGLAELELTRADEDAALRLLSLTPGVHIWPVANGKSLTPAERAAAVEIGCEDCHAIMIDQPGW